MNNPSFIVEVPIDRPLTLPFILDFPACHDQTPGHGWKPGSPSMLTSGSTSLVNCTNFKAAGKSVAKFWGVTLHIHTPSIYYIYILHFYNIYIYIHCIYIYTYILHNVYIVSSPNGVLEQNITLPLRRPASCRIPSELGKQPPCRAQELLLEPSKICSVFTAGQIYTYIYMYIMDLFLENGGEDTPKIECYQMLPGK